MTQATQEIQNKVRQCITLAGDHFQRPFPLPTVKVNQRGKVAGKALLQLNEIRLNPILLRENPHAFINEVIPHEIAHLIAYQVFGRVRPHGKEWQWIMREVFSVPARATHSFSVSSVQGKTFEYRCDCTTHPLSIRRHNKVLRGESSYNCRDCKQPLIFTGIQLS